jgi:hypothetical protein
MNPTAPVQSVDPDNIFNPGNSRIVVQVNEGCADCNSPFHYRSYEEVNGELIPDNTWCEKCTRREMFTINEFRKCGRIELDLGYWSDEDKGRSGMVYETGGCDGPAWVIARNDDREWSVLIGGEYHTYPNLGDAENELFEYLRESDEI